VKSGPPQLDDAYWGGRRRGYKRGRGTRGKTPFVAAVEVDAAGRPRRMSVNRIKGFRWREIARWNRAKLAPGTTVQSADLACFAAVHAAGCTHRPTVMNGLDIARRRLSLTWVDTLLGNVKNAIHGTYHAIRAKHLDPCETPAALSGRTQLPFQPTIRSREPARAAGHRRRAHPAHAVPAHNVG